MRLVLDRSGRPRTARAGLAAAVALTGGLLGCGPGGTTGSTGSPPGGPSVASTNGARTNDASTAPGQSPTPSSPPATAAGAAPGTSPAAGASPPGVPAKQPRAPRPATPPSGPPRRSRPSVLLPPAAGRFDYQLGGAYTPPAHTAIVERDRSAGPFRGAYGICYVNAFQTQPEELSWWQAHHPTLMLHGAGGYVEDPDWPGEVLLDTSSGVKRAQLLAVVGSWIDSCAARGFQAVEPDNLDSYTRSGGRLSVATNRAFVAALVARAHARGLAVAQKNTVELTAKRRSIGFDFAVAEECQVYDECKAYMAGYGSHVLEVEYSDNGLDAFTQACRARARQISIVLRDRDLVPAGEPGYAYRSC